MPLAKDVAAELQKLVDKLNNNPKLEIVTPLVYFSGFYGDNAKERFLDVVKILPRPLKKEYNDYELAVSYTTNSMYIRVPVSRDKVCEIVVPAQPARYRCESLLNEAEDAELITEE